MQILRNKTIVYCAFTLMALTVILELKAGGYNITLIPSKHDTFTQCWTNIVDMSCLLGSVDSLC